MPPPGNADEAAELRWNDGGHGGRPPLARGLRARDWRPGMPAHWTEEGGGARARHLALRGVSALQLVAALAYLQYRARSTLNVFGTSPPLLAFQVFFFVVECLSVIGIPLRALELWRSVRRNAVDFSQIPHEMLEPMPTYYKSARNSTQRNQPRDDRHKNYPFLAALICTYNEPVSLVKQTVRAMLAVNYPHTCFDVYVCDDGHRAEMRSMVRRLARKHPNLHYETRPDNAHAKAGNLNFTLNRTQSDLFIVLDADFVVRPNLVQRLLPYFYNYNERLNKYQFNESLSCVQSPQQFRNLSPYDSDPLDQRSTMFFNLTQLSKDYFNASTLVGTTNLLARRPARDVGYFPNSVTEDSAMSIMLHSKGYRTYVSVLSVAVADRFTA